MSNPPNKSRRILYCRCAFAKVVPVETKDEVLRDLCDTGLAFDAVPDLCEMSARKDPALEDLADTEQGELVIAACYPRAVKWLFHGAGAPLPEQGVVCVVATPVDSSLPSIEGGSGEEDERDPDEPVPYAIVGAGSGHAGAWDLGPGRANRMTRQLGAGDPRDLAPVELVDHVGEAP